MKIVSGHIGLNLLSGDNAVYVEIMFTEANERNANINRGNIGLKLQKIIDSLVFERTHEWRECPECYGQGWLQGPEFTVCYCGNCLRTGYILVEKRR